MEISTKNSQIKLGPQYCSTEELTDAMTKIDAVFDGSHSVGCQVSTSIAMLVFGLMAIPASSRLVILERLLQDLANLTARTRQEALLGSMSVPGDTLH